MNCANSNGAGTNDVITLTNSTYTLTAADNATDDSNGLPMIADAAVAGTLRINGNGATIERSSADGTPNFRILEVASGGSLTLDSITLTNGHFSYAGVGGGISNEGSLTLVNSTVSGNSADYGGGIVNSRQPDPDQQHGVGQLGSGASGLVVAYLMVVMAA